jgi:hypothetical protein
MCYRDVQRGLHDCTGKSHNWKDGIRPYQLLCLHNLCKCYDFAILHNKKYMKFKVVVDFNSEFYLEEHFHSSYNVNLEQERNECVVAFGQL